MSARSRASEGYSLPDDDPLTQYRRARHLLNQGARREARTIIESLVARGASDPMPYECAARFENEDGNWDKGAALLEEARKRFEAISPGLVERLDEEHFQSFCDALISAAMGYLYQIQLARKYNWDEGSPLAAPPASVRQFLKHAKAAIIMNPQDPECQMLLRTIEQQPLLWACHGHSAADAKAEIDSAISQALAPAQVDTLTPPLFGEVLVAVLGPWQILRTKADGHLCVRFPPPAELARVARGALARAWEMLKGVQQRWLNPQPGSGADDLQACLALRSILGTDCVAYFPGGQNLCSVLARVGYYKTFNGIPGVVIAEIQRARPQLLNLILG